jgi:transcription antitermination factor NusG
VKEVLAMTWQLRSGKTPATNQTVEVVYTKEMYVKVMSGEYDLFRGTVVEVTSRTLRVKLFANDEGKIVLVRKTSVEPCLCLMEVSRASVFTELLLGGRM